jgi:hypothetical protein
MKKPSVAFTRPVVGPKVYVTTGPSGWPEQFVRRTADGALAKFIAPLDVSEQVQNFIDLSRTKEGAQTWGDVMEYLHAVTDRRPPAEIGVAFWGHAVAIDDAAEEADDV